jgi:hypothetical protein
MCRLFCGALLFCAGVISPGFALEFPTQKDFLGVIDLSPESAWVNYETDPASADLVSTLSFQDETRWPTFTLSDTSAVNTTWLNDDEGASRNDTVEEWDNLWRNSSRVPFTAVPEPGSLALLAGGALLLWAKRRRSRSLAE